MFTIFMTCFIWQKKLTLTTNCITTCHCHCLFVLFLLLKVHNLIFLSNKICLNLINTFVMSRNKHISKKTPCFSCKRSKNKAKPNEFERCILKLSCYTCSDNPKCRHAFSMFRNASSQNEFRFTFYVVWLSLRLSLPRGNNRRLKNCMKLDENKT